MDYEGEGMDDDFNLDGEEGYAAQDNRDDDYGEDDGNEYDYEGNRDGRNLEDNRNDQEFESALSEVEKYRQVLEKSKELERTVIFQKAKIEALQSELDGAISLMNEKDIMIEQLGKNDKNIEGISDKYNKQISTLNENLKKASAQNNKNEKRISTLEAQLAESEKKIERFERESKKVSQDTNVKDVRLNRVVEELEKYKLKLKETKDSETGKTQEIREEMDKVLEENRKLERQRNELLQAFKKTNETYCYIKQKLHIEAAKMLSFTEDEFTKLLDV